MSLVGLVVCGLIGLVAVVCVFWVGVGAQRVCVCRCVWKLWMRHGDLGGPTCVQEVARGLGVWASARGFEQVGTNVGHAHARCMIDTC